MAPRKQKLSTMLCREPHVLLASLQDSLKPAQHRLLKRVAYISLFVGMLQSGQFGAAGTLVVVMLMLLWMQWDIVKVCEHREVGLKAAAKLDQEIVAFALRGHPARATSVGRFDSVRNKTHCIFARQAVVWGNDWDSELSLEANVDRCLPRLFKACKLQWSAEAKGTDAEVVPDAFVIEACGPELFTDVRTFGETVRRILGRISCQDPAGVDCMASRQIDKRGWYFQFARESFFITCFAPCYPSAHARYQFGEHPESCFVLLQPEMSFLRKDLPPDAPRSQTNWEHPKTVRDRIRANFYNAGREYPIPETVRYPPAHFIVPPIKLWGPTVEFWRPYVVSQTRSLDGANESILEQGTVVD